MKNLLKKIFNGFNGTDISNEESENLNFTDKQIEKIKEGLKDGLNPEILKSPNFTAEQTELIRKGLLNTITVEELREIIKTDWDTSIDYTDEQIEEIRNYLLQDMSKNEILEKMAKNS